MAQPLLEQEYASFNDASKAIKDYCEWQGGAAVRRRSKTDPKTKELKKVTFCCDRSKNRGKSKSSPKEPRRKTKTIKCDCPWKITLVYYKSTEFWTVKIDENVHNHESTKASAHPMLRREEIDAKMMKYIENESTGSKQVIVVVRRVRTNHLTE